VAILHFQGLTAQVKNNRVYGISQEDIIVNPTKILKNLKVLKLYVYKLTESHVDFFTKYCAERTLDEL
jgi:hypothetical protein